LSERALEPGSKLCQRKSHAIGFIPKISPVFAGELDTYAGQPLLVVTRREINFPMRRPAEIMLADTRALHTSVTNGHNLSARPSHEHRRVPTLSLHRKCVWH
jgi:hypothetical protein